MGKQRQGRVHLVGSIAMETCEDVFRQVSAAVGPLIDTLPDGETGERSRWIYFQLTMLENHPAMEIDPDAEPLRLHQWDGVLLREMPLLRFRQGVDPATVTFPTGYEAAARSSFVVFQRLQADGTIPPHVRFQVCLPTPMASGYMYISPNARDAYLDVYMRSLLAALADILKAVPEEKLCIQFDVCQEVLVFENYFPERPHDYREQIFAELATLGDAVPETIPMGYHLCYGSPYDQHLVMPKDAGILAELMMGIIETTTRKTDFIHLPVPQDRTDEAYFRPLASVAVPDETQLYLGLVHHDDETGDRLRIEAARKYFSEFGIATACGWGRTDPSRVPGLLASHRRAAQYV